ncbi:MAG: peptidylprolyl isomerase [Armatimonadota bacterium]
MGSLALRAATASAAALMIAVHAAPQEGTSADPVATVNGQPISRADFDKALLLRHGVRVLAEMVQEALVEQAAKAKGIEVTEDEIRRRMSEVAARREAEKIRTGIGFREWMQANFISPQYFRDMTRIELLKEKIVEDTIEVTDKDLEEFWIKYQNRPPITFPEKRRVSHICFGFDDYDTAVTVLEAVKKQPEKFGDLARKHSIDWTSKERGGDLGYIVKGRNPDPLQKAVFELAEPGLVPEVIKTRMGYHVVRLEDIKPPVTRKFEDAKDDIEDMIRLDRLRRAVQQWTAQQLKTADIKYFLKLGEPTLPSAPAKPPEATGPTPAPAG